MTTKVACWLCGDLIPVKDALRLILRAPKEALSVFVHPGCEPKAPLREITVVETGGTTSFVIDV